LQAVSVTHFSLGALPIKAVLAVEAVQKEKKN